MRSTIMTLAVAGLMFATSADALAGDKKRGEYRYDRIERHADRHYDRKQHKYYRDRKPVHYRAHRKASRDYGHRGKRHASRHYRDRKYGYRNHRHDVRRYYHARGHHCRVRDRHYHNGYAYHGALESIIVGAVALSLIDELLDH